MLRILVFGMSTGMGGVETFLMNLYRNMDINKLQLDFVIEGDSCYYSDEIKSLGGKIYFITPRKESMIQNIIDLIKLYKKCRTTYKIVYFNLSSLYYNFQYIIARFFKFPVIVVHSHSARAKNVTKNLRYYLHCLNRLHVSLTADYMFSCSKPAAEWIFGKKRAKKVKIVPNAINCNLYTYNEEIRKKTREELGIKEDQFVVGNVGRFTYVKNHLFILDIFKKIIEYNKNSVLLLVGDGELKNDVEKAISKHNLNKNVLLTGQRTDVPKLLQAMDVFILPSLYEGLPYSLIEAQASGLKCFASTGVPHESNITGLVDYIDLEADADFWAKEIINKTLNERSKMVDVIKVAGFDIKNTSNYMQEFFLKQKTILAQER